jgi:hypothetical protein
LLEKTQKRERSEPIENSTQAVADVSSLDEITSSSAPQILARVADPVLTEDLAFSILQRSDLPPQVLAELSKNSAVAKSRKVRLAVVIHPKTPRYISLSWLQQLFAFDLMKVALTSVIAGDIKAAAEEALIKRLESLSSGERTSLARRASGRVAGALLRDPEARVIRTTLENPRLTEAIVIKALNSPSAPAVLVRAVCEHPKWLLRREIRIALLRNEKTPIRFLEEFAQSFSRAQLKEILENSRLPQAVKNTIVTEHR